MASAARTRHQLAAGLGFLAPNIIGFLAFTLVPLAFSLVLAFSNWDLRLHNRFRNEPLHFAGFKNFVRLVTQPSFWRFLGNTLFLMMGVPFSIAGSLVLALLLSHDLRGGHRRVFIVLIAGALVLSSALLLLLVGLNAQGMILLLGGMLTAIVLLGVMGGTAIYRTFLYLPHFTAGVATILLWKSLYNPHTGPINQFLTPILNAIARAVNSTPAPLVRSLLWICLALLLWVLNRGLRRIRVMWSEGDLGWVAATGAVALVLLPVVLAMLWAPQPEALVLVFSAAALLCHQLFKTFQGRQFFCFAGQGFGSGLVLGMGLMVCELVLLGLGIVFARLPAMAADGLHPPGWHTDYSWAKPAMMIIAFWAALGSNNMLLYLAGLTNVPAELHEAAHLDGASGFQRFWNVTWPQLAPTTFFIVVMSVIGGLQGGFETARALTRGGPDGATTTLSYFIYTEGFETGRLGYSSAVAWTLFLMVFGVTLLNWKFGSRYVNE